MRKVLFQKHSAVLTHYCFMLEIEDSNTFAVYQGIVGAPGLPAHEYPLSEWDNIYTQIVHDQFIEIEETDLEIATLARLRLVDTVMANQLNRQRDFLRPLEIVLYTKHRSSDGLPVFEVPVIKEGSDEPIKPGYDPYVKPVLPVLPAGTFHGEQQIRHFFTRDMKRCLVALPANSVMGKALLREGLFPLGLASYHPAAAMNYWDPEFSSETEPATRIRCNACGLLFTPSDEMALIEITAEANETGWIFNENDAYCPEDHLFHPDNLPEL